MAQPVARSLDADWGDRENLRLVRDAVRDILAGGSVEERWQRLAAGGFVSCAWDDSLGRGYGRVVAEEIGRTGAALPWTACAVAGGSLLAQSFQPMALSLLSGMAAGRLLVALALRGDLNDPPLKASCTDSGFNIDGVKRNVLCAADAQWFIVQALVGDALCGLFLVPATASGCRLAPFTTLDGAQAADVYFENVGVGGNYRLDAGNAETMLQTSLDAAVAAQTAETAGVTIELLRLTLDYVETRRQFGRPLVEFQAVQQQLAEMMLACEETLAAGGLAAPVGACPADERSRTVSASRVKSLDAARFVWQHAIQLHGAMGTTAGCAIAPLVKRLLVMERCFGTHDEHLVRYARGRPARGAHRIVHEGADDGRFLDEVRTFLSTAVSDQMRAAKRATVGFVVDAAIGLEWHRHLNRRGWVAPGWPLERGGTGWSLRQQYLFELESERADAPRHNVMGLRMVGPLLMQFGTPAQQAKYLPRILSGADYWCQGYSEPGAGSDLAALATRAVRQGDVYVVNGSKIWTTHAQYANQMFALVRTSTTESRQAGISFLLIDMTTPGITVVPIETLDGQRDLNQVFFDQVRVPAENLVGAENDGWRVAKALLEFERGGGFAAPELRVRHERIEPPSDRGLYLRWLTLGVDVEIFEAMELGFFSGIEPVFGRELTPSLLKLEASTLRQSLGELTVDIQGEAGLRDPAMMNKSLADRAHSIFGGTSEIQKGIIARILRQK